MTKMALPKINVSGLLREEFGGPTAFIATADVLGYPSPPLATVSKWVNRRSMPAPWLTVAAVMCKAQGRTLDLARYTWEERSGS